MATISERFRDRARPDRNSRRATHDHAAKPGDSSAARFALRAQGSGCVRDEGCALWLDPIVPFFGDDAFGELSPLRRVPVFIDDKVSLCDSTVICEYLEDRFPSPRAARRPARRAQARWLEEFSDTRMGDVFIWRIFYEAVVLPFIFQKPRDKEKIAAIVAEQVPDVMAYQERWPAPTASCGDVSMADLAVAIPFGNLRWARVEPDRNRWPKTCAWVERTHATPALAKVTRFADKLMQTPPNGQCAALAEPAMVTEKEGGAAHCDGKGAARTLPDASPFL